MENVPSNSSASKCLNFDSRKPIVFYIFSVFVFITSRRRIVNRSKLKNKLVSYWFPSGQLRVVCLHTFCRQFYSFSTQFLVTFWSVDHQPSRCRNWITREPFSSIASQPVIEFVGRLVASPGELTRPPSCWLDDYSEEKKQSVTRWTTLWGHLDLISCRNLCVLTAIENMRVICTYFLAQPWIAGARDSTRESVGGLTVVSKQRKILFVLGKSHGWHRPSLRVHILSFCRKFLANSRSLGEFFCLQTMVENVLIWACRLSYVMRLAFRDGTNPNSWNESLVESFLAASRQR